MMPMISTSSMALVPYQAMSTNTLSKYEDMRTMLEAEYDEEIGNERARKKAEKVDMRKMLKEHDAGTERLLDMTNKRSRLMQLMIKKDFKSFHTELRPQQLVPQMPAILPSIAQKPMAIANGSSAPRSIHSRN